MNIDIKKDKRTMKSLDIESSKEKVATDLPRFEKLQRWVFISTFMNYAMAHWTRKSYTNVKLQLMHAGVNPLTVTVWRFNAILCNAIQIFVSLCLCVFLFL